MSIWLGTSKPVANLHCNPGIFPCAPLDSVDKGGGGGTHSTVKFEEEIKNIIITRRQLIYHSNKMEMRFFFVDSIVFVF